MIPITLGGYQGPESVHNRAARDFGEALAARLGDEVAFTLEPDVTARGHKATDLLDMVEIGELTLCYFSASYLAKRVPEVQIFDVPFLVKSRVQAYAALDGALGALLKERFAANTGFRVLGFWDNGFRHISNAHRPIRRPADCTGLTMRTMNSEMHQNVFRRLGFEPLFVDIKDFREAVASGLVDAQENPLTNTFGFGFNRYHRYITLTGHFFGLSLLLCHGVSYDSWPAEVRAAVDEAAAIATARQRGYAAAEDDAVFAKVDPNENEIIELTDEERAAFAAAARPVVDALRTQLGDELFAFFGDG